MIVLENLHKTYVLKGQHKVISNGINAVFPSGVSVGLLGRNGAGKSSLLNMIAGFLLPDYGRIRVEGSISWPVGFSGSFHRDLTGIQNIRFVARTYGVDSDELIAFVRDFAGLGEQFHLPVRTYSSGMRSRLAFGISMGIRFDTYLVDEVTAVGDAEFKEKSRVIFADRMRESGAIVVSHSMGTILKFCQAGAVLEDGTLTYYDDINDAIDHHKENMAQS